MEGVGDSSNLILLVASPRCWTRSPKEDRLFPSKRALFASSVSAQSRKLISIAVNQNPEDVGKNAEGFLNFTEIFLHQKFHFLLNLPEVL